MFGSSRLSAFVEDFYLYAKSDCGMKDSELGEFKACLELPWFKKAIEEKVINNAAQLIISGKFKKNLSLFFKDRFYLDAWRENLIDHEYLLDTGFQTDHLIKLLGEDNKGLKLLRRLAELNPGVDSYIKFGDDARKFIENLYKIDIAHFKKLDFDALTNLDSIEKMTSALDQQIENIKDQQPPCCVM